VRIDIGAFEVQIAGLTVTGDYNRNNVVDAGDCILWWKTLGTTGLQAFSGADGDGDTTIGPDDVRVWRSHFGDALPPGAGSVAVATTGIGSTFQHANAAVLTFVESPPSEAQANIAISVALALFEDRTTQRNSTYPHSSRLQPLRFVEAADDHLLLLANDHVKQSSRQGKSWADASASDNESHEKMDDQGLANDPLAVALTEWR
jgi:hypothetical protein